MEPGFVSFGSREAAAVLLAVVIVVDWALLRYARRGARAARPPFVEL